MDAKSSSPEKDGCEGWILLQSGHQIEELEKDGCEIIVAGDWNIQAPGTQGLGRSGKRGWRSQAWLRKYILRSGVLADVRSSTNGQYDQPTMQQADCEMLHGVDGLRRHTYHNTTKTGSSFTNPDFALASRTLLQNKTIKQCAIELS